MNTKLIVGHNDPGYLPDEEPQEVASLSEAIRCMVNDVQNYFLPELDPEGVDLTPEDIRRMQQKVSASFPVRGSTVILRGHAFWIM